MREDAFRAFLAQRYSGTVAGSILSCARRVERVLRVDLDHLLAADHDLRALPRTLEAAGVPAKAAASCAAAVRRYAECVIGAERSPRPTQRPPAPVVRPRSAIVAEASVPELMRLYGDILAELRERGIVRTANGPVGDYAEWLFARAFGWTLTGNSAAQYDAVDDAGTRYQIKGRRIGSGPGSRQLGALRRVPDAGFDVLAAVLFDRDLAVFRAALIPYRVVVERARRVEHTNSWRFMLGDDVWRLPTVRDATEPLRAAAQTL